MTAYTKAHAARDIADIVAIYFAGVEKTQSELRDFVNGIVNCMPASVRLTAAEAEQIARDNEMRQGVKMFA